MNYKKKKVVAFFAIFISVYFLESIGGFYMTSAVVSIEKQFQISSGLSGLMVSAGDIGYIPTVVFVGYFGGKGNRARWIGGGCMMIAVANLIIGSSHFLFPVKPTFLNSSYVGITLEKSSKRLNHSLSISSFIEYLRSTEGASITSQVEGIFPLLGHNKSLAAFNDVFLSKCESNNITVDMCSSYLNYLHEINAPTQEEISNIRIFTGLPFAVCSTLINSLRKQIKNIQCSRTIANIGPFSTIFGGLILLGIGRTMPFSLGLPLIDDNVKRKNLPVYFAFMFFIRILGPTLGLFIGSMANKYYYTSDAPPGITPRDPMWIGRWWVGFLFIGVFLFFPSLALFLFPTFVKTDVLPTKEQTTELLEKSRSSKMHKRSRSLALVDRHRKSEKNLTPREQLTDFFKTVVRVVKLPVYTLALVGRILDVFAFKGFFVFLPKYLEIQFGIPQYKINQMMGVIGVSGFAVGSISGSIIMRRCKLEGRKAATWVALCSAVAACLSFVNSAVGCKSVLTSLVNSPNGIGLHFNGTCNAACDCTDTPLYPVCNNLGQPFYSPCHAGCSYSPDLNEDSALKIFKNCECSGTTNRTLSRDFCHQAECDKKFVYYFISMAFSGLFSGLSVVPSILIVLRAVPPSNRSVSLGFQSLLVSLLATLPSPVVWGWIIDKTCILWNSVCGDPAKGACAIYDADKLRVRLHVTYGIMRLVSLITDIFVIYYAKDLVLMNEEEEEPTADEKADELKEMNSAEAVGNK